jgi:hypothetical protein
VFGQGGADAEQHVQRRGRRLWAVRAGSGDPVASRRLHREQALVQGGEVDEGLADLEWGDQVDQALRVGFHSLHLVSRDSECFTSP